MFDDVLRLIKFAAIHDTGPAAFEVDKQAASFPTHYRAFDKIPDFYGNTRIAPFLHERLHGVAAFLNGEGVRLILVCLCHTGYYTDITVFLASSGKHRGYFLF